MNNNGGKIILKKINHFFDNTKINKLYKHDLTRIDNKYIEAHL